VQLPEALRDALGQIIANERREWRRERELIEAQARTAIAELRAENVALVARLEETVLARLATLRDGKDGVDGRDGVDGKDGRDGLDGKDGADGAPGRDGIDGRDGADGALGKAGPPGERGADGSPGKDGRDGIDGRDGVDGPAGLPGERGPQGEPGERGAPGADGRDGVDGQNGADGLPGERGEPGPPGKLPVVRAWRDDVHYEGAVVAHAGSVYQAQRDTGREPPHDDWLCIAQGGQDGANGRSLNIRGTWSDTETYRHLDVVAYNGGSFVARRDDPGLCPGDGWQLHASPGKRGQPGEPGRRGEPGPPGSPLIEASVDEAGLVTFTNADRSSISLDLYPLLTRVAH
jgi:hypothetical protein